jgi:carboxypeptidase C (cathepsin A)
MKSMKIPVSFLLIFLAFTTSAYAQKESKEKQSAQNNPMVIVDSSVTIKNTVTIKGQTVPYTAKSGTLPIWDENGKPIASVFYTYYERSDVKDRTSRPLVISFNGGPGTPSVWMEIGYTGHRILDIDD